MKLTPRKNSSTIRIQGPPDITSMIQNPKPLKKVIVSNVPTFDPLMDMEMQPVASTTTQVLDQLLTQPLPNTAKPEAVCSEHSPTITDKVQDWSILAQVLQEDFEGHDNFDFDQEFDESSSTNAGSSFFTEAADDWEKHEHDDEPYLKCFTKSPLSFVTRTCRSELVDSLLAAQGDVTDGRFVKALEVLSSIYAASNHKTDPEIFISKFLNGSWVSLSKPAYGGCLGKNQQGDYLYTLGKLSFGMFKPANLKCSVHHTLNNIRHACEIDTAPTAAPWSLRRELALMDPDNPGKPTFKPQASTLRNYEYVACMQEFVLDHKNIAILIFLFSYRQYRNCPNN